MSFPNVCFSKCIYVFRQSTHLCFQKTYLFFKRQICVLRSEMCVLMKCVFSKRHIPKKALVMRLKLPVQSMIIVVHTLAFGGRGIFFAGVGGARGGRKGRNVIFPSILATTVLVGSFFTGYGNDLDSTSTWTCNVPCTLEAQVHRANPKVQKKKKHPSNKRRSWKTLFIFSIFLVAVVLVGSFVVGDGNRLFDSNCGYPGEGPDYTMTAECAKWYKNNFSDEQVRAIAKKIAFLKQSYRHTCMQSRYNYCNGGSQEGTIPPMIVYEKLLRS